MATLCGLAQRLAFSCFSPPHADSYDQLLRCRRWRSCLRMHRRASGGFRCCGLGRLQAGGATVSLRGRFPQQTREQTILLRLASLSRHCEQAPLRASEGHARICTRECCGALRAFAPRCSSFSGLAVSESPLGTRQQTFRHYQERHRQRSLLANFRPGRFLGCAVRAAPGRRFAPASPAKPQHFVRRRGL
jgi:hypothetical protein